MPDSRDLARRLARESLEQGDSTGWFEKLYAEVQGDATLIMWADMEAPPGLVKWLDGRGDPGPGQKALVIGCGLGDDSEEMAKRGYAVTAFDIAPSAIKWCRKRFPQSQADYVVADLFSGPAEWRQGFDLVLERYTLQTFLPDVRVHAMRCMAEFVAPGGSLLVITRGRDSDQPIGDLPWPLTKADLAEISKFGMEESRFDDYFDEEDPPKRRFRVEYRRPK